MRRSFMVFIGAALAAAALTAAVANAAATASGQVVHTACFGVQGGDGVSRYDLNLYGKLERVCIVGRRGPAGLTGARGARGAPGVAGTNGADGKDGTITGVVAVCASEGGNLKLCGGDNGHDLVGYLALTN